MKKKHHTPAQIVKKLRKVERLTAEGSTVKEAVRQIEVTEQTYYRWRKEYGEMNESQLKELKELREENRRLKHVVADLSVDKAILEEALKGKY